MTSSWSECFGECGKKEGYQVRDIFCVEIHTQNQILFNFTNVITAENEVYENLKVENEYCLQQPKPVICFLKHL